MVGTLGGWATRPRVSRVKDAHSGLAMHVIGVRVNMPEESLWWWVDCSTMSIRVTWKEGTTRCLIKLNHHNGEGEHHDGVMGQGGHGSKRELEGGGEILAPWKAQN
jgi:hypothetical protein